MKKHKNIMIQGTGSSVGKTLIVAGLCRVFAQDGYRVSPFKSQNMALNSFVDIEGLELSRGTVIQAEAGYEIPRAFMNPILLKPNSDNNSQVIINGKVVYTADAKNYFSHSKELKEIALHAYKNNINVIQRFFILDSLSYEKTLLNIKEDKIIAAEIMPGLMPKIIKKLSQETHIPIITGGLIKEKEDVINAINAGALSVSTTEVKLWED